MKAQTRRGGGGNRSTVRSCINLSVCLVGLWLLCSLVPRRPTPEADQSRTYLGLDMSAPGVPPGLVNQYDEERDFLRFHRCSNEGEAFAGSWLVTREHLISSNLSYNLAQANAELAALLVAETRRSRKAWQATGALMQTLDVFDFSVIHLSAYERLYRQYGFDLEEGGVDAEIAAAMRGAAAGLRAEAEAGEG